MSDEMTVITVVSIICTALVLIYFLNMRYSYMALLIDADTRRFQALTGLFHTTTMQHLTDTVGKALAFDVLDRKKDRKEGGYVYNGAV